jgi:hypothetical protein
MNKKEAIKAALDGKVIECEDDTLLKYLDGEFYWAPIHSTNNWNIVDLNYCDDVDTYKLYEEPKQELYTDQELVDMGILFVWIGEVRYTVTDCTHEIRFGKDVSYLIKTVKEMTDTFWSTYDGNKRSFIKQ